MKVNTVEQIIPGMVPLREAFPESPVGQAFLDAGVTPPSDKYLVATLIKPIVPDTFSDYLNQAFQRAYPDRLGIEDGFPAGTIFDSVIFEGQKLTVLDRSDIIPDVERYFLKVTDPYPPID